MLPKMPNLIYLVLPSPSHYHAVMPFAREKANQGNHITFVGSKGIQHTVEKEGFSFVEWDYTIVYRVSKFKVALSVWLKSLLDEEYKKSFRNEFYDNMGNVRSLVKGLNAKELFIDEHLADYALFLEGIVPKINIVCTKISTRKAKNVPPMNSYWLPSISLLSSLKSALLWQKHYLQKKMEHFRNKLIFQGRDEESMFKEFLDSKGIQPKIRNHKDYFYTGIEGLERIILGHKNFDFPWRTVLPHECFVFLPIERNESPYFSEKYQLLRQEIPHRNQKVVYFSFGTVSYRNVERVSKLLENILCLVLKRKDILLIVSLSNLPLRYEDYDNVKFFEYIPQLDLLTQCDLMITHGGHNSIKECIQKKVKMLVYPHKEDNDQPGNAARVHFHKIGIMGKIGKDSIKTIEKKMDKLLFAFDTDFSKFQIDQPSAIPAI